MVRVEGKRLPPVTDHVYLALNKPRGVVSTMSDPQGRRTLSDLVADRPECSPGPTQMYVPRISGWRNALALPERWQAPSFPIGGNDVMALGELKGPEIGEVLKQLERDWIESGFALDRDQLLAKASALIAASTLVHDDPDQADQGRGESERERHDRDLEHDVAAAHRSGGRAHLAPQELAKARVALAPARVLQCHNSP